MTIERTYLDYNATAPMKPGVKNIMTEAMGLIGNASAVYAEGRQARARLESARQSIADLLSVPVNSIVFTSGATEANVTALSPDWTIKNPDTGNITTIDHCFYSAVEHSSVLKGGRFHSDQLTKLKVTGDGVVDVDDLSSSLEDYCENHPKSSFMTSVMLANNETGALQPVKEIAGIVHEFGGVFHCDAVQAVGKVKTDFSALQADLVSLSAHKIAGPQGVGALIVNRPDVALKTPLLRGGGQELKRRAGTENLIGIVGFGEAASLAADDLEVAANIEYMRDRMEEQILSIVPEAVIFSKSVSRLPNTTFFAVPGLSAEMTIIALDLVGISVSAGSACSSGKVERSHVLKAMGIAPDLSSTAIRISLGWQTSKEDIARFVEAFGQIYRRSRDNQAAA